MLHDLNFWRTFALIAAAVGQTAFVLLYMTFPWYSTFLGRALFGKALALVLIVDFAALSRVFDFGRSDLAFSLLYGVLALGICWQFIAFFRVRLAGWRDEQDGQVSGNRVSLDG